MELRSPESIKEARWVWWITYNLSAKEGVDTEMPEQATTQTSKMSISKFREAYFNAEGGEQWQGIPINLEPRQEHAHICSCNCTHIPAAHMTACISTHNLQI